jgi:hypothetical protein
MARCDPWQSATFEITETEPNVYASFQPQAECWPKNWWIRLPVPGTSDEVEPSDPVLSRIICRLILAQLPDEALHEAIEALIEMWRFYRMPVTQLPPPRLATMAARLGETYVRPEFQLTED